MRAITRKISNADFIKYLLRTKCSFFRFVAVSAGFFLLCENVTSFCVKIIPRIGVIILQRPLRRNRATLIMAKGVFSFFYSFYTRAILSK